MNYIISSDIIRKGNSSGGHRTVMQNTVTLSGTVNCGDKRENEILTNPPVNSEGAAQISSLAGRNGTHPNKCRHWYVNPLSRL